MDIQFLINLSSYVPNAKKNPGKLQLTRELGVLIFFMRQFRGSFGSSSHHLWGGGTRAGPQLLVKKIPLLFLPLFDPEDSKTCKNTHKNLFHSLLVAASKKVVL